MHSRSTRLLATLAVAIAAAAVLGGCSELPIPDLRFPVPGKPVVYPRIVPVEGAPAIDPAPRSFSFERSTVAVDAPIDGAVYAGAHDGDKAARRLVDVGEKDWVPGYYRAFVDESHLEPFYAGILAPLRDAKAKLNLDDDRYLELITAFVQSLPYKIDEARPEPKYPIETYADGVGDCDDKSLLLVALLEREGYDVALLHFGPEQHIAVGVRCPELDYRGTGYAYIETTLGSFVGIPPDTLAGGKKIESEPWVIPISDGGRAFGATAAGQIAWLRDARTRAVGTQKKLAAQIERERAQVKQRNSDVDSLRTQLDSARAAGRIDEYNALVPRFNQAADDYNAAVKALNATIARHNALVDAMKSMDERTFDRTGTYSSARAAGL